MSCGLNGVNGNFYRQRNCSTGECGSNCARTNNSAQPSRGLFNRGCSGGCCSGGNAVQGRLSGGGGLFGGFFRRLFGGGGSFGGRNNDYNNYNNRNNSYNDYNNNETDLDTDNDTDNKIDNKEEKETEKTDTSSMSDRDKKIMGKTEWHNEFLSLINNYRKSKRLNPLEMDSSLCKGMLAHTEKMSNGYGMRHSNLKEIGQKGGYKGFVNTENIAQGQISPKEVFEAWRTSPGHNANMLNSDATKLGFAFNKGYWGMITGKDNFFNGYNRKQNA